MEFEVQFIKCVWNVLITLMYVQNIIEIVQNIDFHVKDLIYQLNDWWGDFISVEFN